MSPALQGHASLCTCHSWLLQTICYHGQTWTLLDCVLHTHAVPETQHFPSQGHGNPSLAFVAKVARPESERRWAAFAKYDLFHEALKDASAANPVRQQSACCKALEPPMDLLC